MMTNLSKLSVSLTKHGAHKIALLLAKYDKDEVLKHLWGTDDGINIESAQAHKNLSVKAGGKVPDLWNKAREHGEETINALVLIAIIFSHHALISAMKNGAGTTPLSGTIIRGKQLNEKAYTNFAHTIEELGFSTEHSYNHVDYNLSKLFKIPGLNGLVAELLQLKLKAAGWDQKNSLQDELIAHDFQQVFSVSKERFLEWFNTGGLPAENLIEDAPFFLATDELPAAKSKPFKFVAGHNKKKTGKVIVTAPQSDGTASLLHNEMQNRLYSDLVAKYGEKSVGTEVPTGHGTSIDIVVKTDKFCWFIEIKTDHSAKACIRQAIPQLLEYAYWDGKADKVDELIVVGPAKPTPETESYLAFLRETFSIPISYQFHDVNAA